MRDSAFPAARLAVFEDRLILDAQPPVSDAEIARVQASLAGRVPPDLLALWKLCYGGRLDYDLEVAFGDHIHPMSFTEIFYPGSKGYRDLDGWIAHELELLQEYDEAAGRGGQKQKLEYLPFGGFEYLERLYVRVGESDYGAVYAFAEGIPPAWSLQLHEAASARIADGVRELFRALYLEGDPSAADAEDYAHGLEIADALEEARAQGTLGEGEAAELDAAVAGAVVNWRSALEDGTITGNPRLVRLAMEHAARMGNLGILQRLDRLRIDLARPLSGRGSVLDHALMQGQLEMANALLDRGLRGGEQTLQCAPGSAPSALLRRLHAAGAVPSEDAVFNAVYAGHLDNAELVARWLLDQDPKAREGLVDGCAERAQSNETEARNIELGLMESNRPPAAYREEAGWLRQFAQRLATL